MGPSSTGTLGPASQGPESHPDPETQQKLADPWALARHDPGCPVKPQAVLGPDQSLNKTAVGLDGVSKSVPGIGYRDTLVKLKATPTPEFRIATE